MIKNVKNITRQDKEPYFVPKRVQDVIPISCVWPDGIFKVGAKFSKTYRFTDINYMVASREDKEGMFLTYSELLNSLDSSATTKLTISNHRQNRGSCEESILMALRGDGLDEYRKPDNRNGTAGVEDKVSFGIFICPHARTTSVSSPSERRWLSGSDPPRPPWAYPPADTRF